jgi:hypothetical protein
MKSLYPIRIMTLAVMSVLFSQNSKIAQTQTGPGGVGDVSTLAVWLDASHLSLNNGDPVATWTDRSGNGNNLRKLYWLIDLLIYHHLVF